MGPEMMQEFRYQAERFGAEFITDDVTRVDLSERPFRVWVGDDEYRAESVIVATGATARQLGLESERALQGKRRHLLRNLRRGFFRDLACRRGRRRLGHGGGDVPDASSPRRSRWSTGATTSAPPRSCSTGPGRTRRSSSSPTSSSTRCSATTASDAASGCATPRPARPARSRPAASSSRSGTTRRPRSSSTSSTTTTPATW